MNSPHMNKEYEKQIATARGLARGQIIAGFSLAIYSVCAANFALGAISIYALLSSYMCLFVLSASSIGGDE